MAEILTCVAAVDIELRSLKRVLKQNGIQAWSIVNLLVINNVGRKWLSLLVRNFYKKPGPHRLIVLHGLSHRADFRLFLYSDAFTSDHLTLLLRYCLRAWRCDLFYFDVQGLGSQVAQKPDDYFVGSNCWFYSCVHFFGLFRLLVWTIGRHLHGRYCDQPWSQHMWRSNLHHFLV